jgi:Asp-tRNA(Asn)/Glu-tRNA(Gln) amidotransferase C subunit
VTASKESLRSGSAIESSSRKETKKPQSDKLKEYFKLPKRGWMTAEEALQT